MKCGLQKALSILDFKSRSRLCVSQITPGYPKTVSAGLLTIMKVPDIRVVKICRPVRHYANGEVISLSATVQRSELPLNPADHRYLRSYQAAAIVIAEWNMNASSNVDVEYVHEREVERGTT